MRKRAEDEAREAQKGQGTHGLAGKDSGIYLRTKQNYWRV